MTVEKLSTIENLDRFAERQAELAYGAKSTVRQYVNEHRDEILEVAEFIKQHRDGIGTWNHQNAHAPIWDDMRDDVGHLSIRFSMEGKQSSITLYEYSYGDEDLYLEFPAFFLVQNDWRNALQTWHLETQNG